MRPLWQPAPYVPITFDTLRSVGADMPAIEERATKPRGANEPRSVRQDSRCVDGFSVVGCSPPANRVEILEGEPDRISCRVTGCADRILPMPLHARSH